MTLDCTWTASSSDDWIVINPNSSKGGANGSISYTVLKNTLSSPRTGYVTISTDSGTETRIVTISQIGLGSCVCDLDPVVYNLSKSYNTYEFTVDTKCSFTVTSSNPEWIKVKVAPQISYGSSGTGASKVSKSTSIISVEVQPNTEASSRVGTLAVVCTNQSTSQHVNTDHVIIQDGIGCTYTVSSKIINTINDDTAWYTINVSSSDQCSWSALTLDSWININPVTNTGVGSDTVRFQVANNPNPSIRSGKIYIADNIITVYQLGLECVFELDSEIASYPSSGDAETMSGSIVISSLPDVCSWTAQILGYTEGLDSSNSWLHLLNDANEKKSLTSGYGSGVIRYIVDNNPKANNRQLTISVTSGTSKHNKIISQEASLLGYAVTRKYTPVMTNFWVDGIIGNIIDVDLNSILTFNFTTSSLEYTRIEIVEQTEEGVNILYTFKESAGSVNIEIVKNTNIGLRIYDSESYSDTWIVVTVKNVNL